MKRKTVITTPVKLQEIVLEIQGITPLIMNKFSMGQRGLIGEEHLRIIELGSNRWDCIQEIVNFIEHAADIERKIYRLHDDSVGLPAVYFKKAMVEATRYLKDMTKSGATASFFIIDTLVPIKYRRIMVNQTIISIGEIRIVRRLPEFKDWSCELRIKYISNLISVEQLVKLANLAGSYIGVGDKRISNFGRFDVVLLKN